MTTHQHDRQFKGIFATSLVRGLAISLGVASLHAFGDSALAQITILPDASLGTESSTVTSPIPGGFLIEGGATRETNLFHSFEEFSLPSEGIAYFNNALTVENIISRVTGTSVSNIDGLIAANGTANLYLINPNGIEFGSKAALNLGGSFLASTASSLIFDNGFEFSATNPQSPPLLSVNLPLGLQYGANPGRILTQASVLGLQVPTGKTLALVGGEVDIEGGILLAPDGRIELGSVAANSRVSLTPTNTGYALGYGGVENFQDIRLSQFAIASTNGEAGGSIQVHGRNVTLVDGSLIVASTLGGGKGEGLTVNASDSVEVIGTSADGELSSILTVQADRNSTGDAGDFVITTPRLLISGGGQVGASTFGAGNGGNLTVYASQDVQVLGTSADGETISALGAQTAGIGNAGDMSITTSRLLISDGALVSTSTFGAGNGGNLTVYASQDVQVLGTSADGEFVSKLSAQADRNSTGDAGDFVITTPRLLISGGGQVSASTFGAGNGGNLTVYASQDVQVLGTSADGEFFSFLGAPTAGIGNAGDVSITTSRLLISDGAQVSTSTFGAGNGGNLTVYASQDVQMLGTSADSEIASFLGALTAGMGNAGNLSITTSRLLISDGAQVSAATFGEGKGGNLTVDASESVQVTGTSLDGQAPSGLLVNATADGTAGNLTITTREMSIREGAMVEASSPQGQAGNLTITADSLLLDQGFLLAETGQSTSEGGANITLNGLDLLRMDNESLISATALEDANGGNITIDSTFVVATPPTGLEGSDIIANADRGNGGRINITTQGLFGTEFRDELTPDNDITASSDFGLDGEFILNQPDVDPSRGLAELPTEVVDGTNQIDRRCTPGGTAQDSSFTITGRGGLPPNPTDPLTGESVIANWVTLDSEENTDTITPEANPTNAIPNTLVEAQSWVYSPSGQVVLVAQAPTITPVNAWQTSLSCDDFQATANLRK